MPSCKKQFGKSLRGGKLGKGNAQGRAALMMSVIIEETLHERESRAEEQLKPHPDDVAPQDKRPSHGRASARASTGMRSAPESTSDPRSRSTSTASSSSEEAQEPNPMASRVILSPPRNSRMSSRRKPSPTSHPTSQSSARYEHEHHPISSHQVTRSRTNSKETSRSKSDLTLHSASSSSEDEHRQKPSHRPPTSFRTKPSSSSQSRMSAPSHRVRFVSSAPSSQEIPRSKCSTVLDSIHAPHAEEVYDAYPIATRLNQSPPTGARDSLSLKHSHRRHSTSSRRVSGKSQLSKSSAAITSSSADGSRGHRRNASPRSAGPPFDPSKTLRPKSASISPPKTPVVSKSAHSQRQVSPHQDLSLQPSSRAMMPRAKSSTALSSMSPSRMQKAKEHCRFLSAQDVLRSRSSSHGQRRTDSSSGSSTGSIPRSVSASSLTANASTSLQLPCSPQLLLRLRHYEGRFQNRRGQTLFYFSLFPPEKEPMRGVILSLHGIGDHCRRNVSHYERLCMEGFGVITYDLLNHGVSDLDEHKTRAHISNFNHLVEDTNDFITFAKRSIYADALRYWRKHHHPRHPHGEDTNNLLSLPELPLIIAGTSFGSLIGLHTVLSGEHKVHAAVWGSPTVGVTWNPLLWAQSKLAKPLVAVFPTAKVVPAVQHELLCRDPAFLKKFEADPLTTMDMMTTRTGHESLQAMIRLQEDERVTNSDSAFCAVPTLFLAGSADGISDQQAAIKFFATMGNLDKEYKLFDGLYHMVYEEPEKEDVLQYLAQWLHRRFPLETRQTQA